MQAITNPTALELSQEVMTAVAPSEFVNETLNRKSELEQLRNFVKRKEQKAAQKATQRLAEKMLIAAIRRNVPFEAIEVMKEEANITDARLAELRKQAQIS